MKKTIKLWQVRQSLDNTIAFQQRGGRITQGRLQCLQWVVTAAIEQLGQENAYSRVLEHAYSRVLTDRLAQIESSHRLGQLTRTA